MKKYLFLFLLCLMAAGLACANNGKKLYTFIVSPDSPENGAVISESEKTKNADNLVNYTLQKFLDSIAARGVEVIDLRTVAIKPDPGMLRLSERLERKKQEVIYLSRGRLSQRDLELLAEYDRDIAKAKEKEKFEIDIEDINPYLTIWFTTDKNTKMTVSEDGTSYSLEILDYTISAHSSFTIKNNTEKDVSLHDDISLRVLLESDPDGAEDMLMRYLEGHVASIFSQEAMSASSTQQVPELLDERYIPAIDGKSTIAMRDDYSFVISSQETITEYSATWEERQRLEKKLPLVSSQKSDETAWLPACVDGSSVILANLDSPSVMYLDERGSLNKRGLYNFPKRGIGDNFSMGFLRNGEPYIWDSKNTVYFPSSSGAAEARLEIPLNKFLSVKPGLSDEIWIQDYGCIFKYSKASGLKPVLFYNYPTKGETLSLVLDDGGFLTMDVLPDDEFAIKEKEKPFIRRRTADGRIVWTYPLQEKYKNSVCLDGAGGVYIFYDTESKLLWRLTDADAKLPGGLAALKANSGKLDGANLMEKARIYHENADALYTDRSYSAALEYYTLYLEISPADSAAADRKLMCEVEIGKKEAAEKSEEALNLFDEYGEETARPQYSEAMKILEKLKKQVPWDEDVQAMYAELKSAFNPGEGADKQEDKSSLSVDSVELGVLFPALMNVYATNPAGFINVRNTGKSELKNLKVSAYVRKYMDFASEGDTVATLKGGASAPVEIRTVLNQKVLSLNENTVLQMQLTLSWEEDGRKKSTTMTRPVTVYKKSAMSWRDTGMLSCFVLPNDSSVSSFAFAAMDGTGENVLSTQVTKAMRIANALGSLPLNYVADPSTPLDQVIGNEYAVDTVRFPGETLNLKGGDCDDMTTLFCSLLESTGVPSAFVTVPGHIFAAFDTGLKYNSIWKKLGADYAVLERNGHVWIPVEVTVLNKGFSEAWKTASKEIQTEGMELTDLSEAWEVYASVPADGSAASVSVNKAAMSKMNDGSRDAVVRTMTRLLDEATASKMKAKDLNAAAKLYHSMGNDDKAIAVLLKATEQDSSYEASFANLATLYRKQGDTAKAELYAGKSKNARSQVADSGAQDGSSRASSAVEEIWFE